MKKKNYSKNESDKMTIAYLLNFFWIFNQRFLGAGSKGLNNHDALFTCQFTSAIYLVSR